MTKFDVVVSIVLYNSDKDRISQLIDEVFASSNGLKVKVCLVDNSSLVSDYSDVSKKHAVDYIKAPQNGGYGYGHNIAIQKYIEKTKYHLVLNPDIVLGKDTINQMFLYMEANNNIGLAAPKVCNLDGSPQYVARLLPSPFDVVIRFAGIFLPFMKEVFSSHIDKHILKKFTEGKRPYFSPYISGCFMFMRSEVLAKVNGFDEGFFMYYEDVDLSRRMAEKADNVVLANIKVLHEWERASHKKMTLLKAHVKSALYYFRKYGFVFDGSKKKLNNLVRVVRLEDGS